jgi:hypothetical protein
MFNTAAISPDPEPHLYKGGFPLGEISIVQIQKISV